MLIGKNNTSSMLARNFDLFYFREIGMTSWNLDQKSRARMFWEKVLSYTNFDFEYRLAMVDIKPFVKSDFTKKVLL